MKKMISEYQPKLRYKTILSKKDARGKEVRKYQCLDCGKMKTRRVYILNHIQNYHPQRLTSLQEGEFVEIAKQKMQKQQERIHRIITVRQEPFLAEDNGDKNAMTMISNLKKQFDQLRQSVYKTETITQLRIEERLRIATTCAQEIVDNIGMYLLTQIKLKIEIIFHEAVRSGVDVQRYVTQTKLGLMEKIQSLDIGNIFSIFIKQLELHQQRLLADMIRRKLAMPTINRYQAGFLFWRRYENVSSYNWAIITGDLQTLSNNKYRGAIQYYKKMIDSTDLFPNLPKLPKHMRRRRCYIKRDFAKVGIQQIQSHVKSLLDIDQTLACDLWFTAVMGLRKSELLKVKLVDQKGRFCQIIDIFQKKNRHMTIRVIPQSLKKLCKFTNTTYPLNQCRYDKLRSYCIENFHRFYSLRSTCLTTIMTALFDSNVLARFHQGPQVTMKNYIDSTNIKLINAAFKLCIERLEDIQTENQVNKITIDQYGAVIITKMVQNTIMMPTLDPEYDVTERQDAGLVKKEDLDIENIEKEQIEIVNVRNMLFHDFKIEISPLVHDDPLKAISYYLGDEDFEKLSQQKDKQSQSITEFTEERYPVKIKNIEITNGDIKIVESSKLTGQEISLVKIMRTEEKDIFLVNVHDDLLQSKGLKQNENLSKLRKKRDTSYSELSWQFNWSQKCKSCHQNLSACKGICQETKEQHYFMECERCDTKFEHICIQNQDESAHEPSGLILNKNKELQVSFLPAKSQKKRNNISEVIELTGRKKIDNYVYTKPIPWQIATKCDIINDKTSKIIMENRRMEDFLPLTILKTTQFDIFGYGVFATQEIPKNTLICSYLGKLCLLSSFSRRIDRTQIDSLYTLGYITFKTSINELSINPQEEANIGRFINCSKKYANCKSTRHIYNKNALYHNLEPVFEPGLVIIAISDISKGQQLFYDYDEDENYWEAGGEMKEPKQCDLFKQIDNRNVYQRKIKEDKTKKIKKQKDL